MEHGPRQPEFPRRRRAVLASWVYGALLVVAGWCADKFADTEGRASTGVTLAILMSFLVGFVVLFVLWILAAKERIDAGPRIDPPPVRRDNCNKCGYSLAGLDDIAQCPDCGQTLPYGQLMDRKYAPKPSERKG